MGKSGADRIRIRTEKGKYHAMQNKELPIGFVAAIVQDKRAMQNFAKMSEGERESVLRRARQAKTRADMQLLVASLSDVISAAEEY